jgi:membrane protease YdiL (CAAX protease family)
MPVSNWRREHENNGMLTLAQEFTPSIRIYLGLIVVLAGLGALNAFLPQGAFGGLLPEQQALPSRPLMALVTAGAMLFVYGGLGFLGLQLARRLGFADLWDPAVSSVRRFLLPALVGIGTGLFFIAVDVLVQRWHALGPLPHPPFPTSLVASATAGIGEEVIFRLFFVPFWTWVLSRLLLGGRWPDQVFWGVAVLSALVFALAHLPSVMSALRIETLSEVPAVLLGEVILLNGVVSLLAAYGLRHYGLLAAVGVHFWTDVVWHVLWGAIS